MKTHNVNMATLAGAWIGLEPRGKGAGLFPLLLNFREIPCELLAAFSGFLPDL